MVFDWHRRSVKAELEQAIPALMAAVGQDDENDAWLLVRRALDALGDPVVKERE